MAGTYGTSNDEVSLLIARQKKSQTQSSFFLPSSSSSSSSTASLYINPTSSDDDDNDNNIKIYSNNNDNRKKRARLYKNDINNSSSNRKPPSPPPAWGVLGIVASGIALFGILFLFTSKAGIDSNSSSKYKTKFIRKSEHDRQSVSSSLSPSSLPLSSSSASSTSSSSKDSSSDSSSTTFTFTLKRSGYDALDYFTNNTVAKYNFLDDYVTIIEPYSDMDLVIINSDDSSSSSSSSRRRSSSSDYTYKYSVCPVNDDSNDYCQSGELSSNGDTVSVNIACKSYDEYKITVTGYSSDNSDSIGTIEGNGVCMYVRRELRSLTSDDLTATMDAMYTLWSTTEEDGYDLYGENFHNSTYFTSAHDFNAAWQDGDHIHEGLGFLPQHIKITNIFEQSMQAVNPSVTLFYWDFTIDESEDLTIFESPMFTADTFGSLSKPKDSYWGWTYREDNLADAVIQDGRWANVKADYNYAYPALQNGYGYIRGPWNTNPSPNVVRFAAYAPTLPSCLDYFAWGSDTDFVDFLEIAAYGPHASTHGVIGSVFGCDMLDPLLKQGLIKDEDSQVSICKKWGFYMKELYRGNYIKSKSECTATSLTEDGMSCGFQCNEGQYDDMLEELRSTISDAYVPNLSESEWEQWRDFICTGDGYKVFVGDHLESASPSDPSFWPIHPTQERLLQAKFMSGAFSVYKWPEDAVANYVCDKSKCYEPESNSVDFFDDCCYGHYEYDQLLDFVNGDKNSGYGPTNHEIFANTNPSGDYAMPYIYDNFKWEHCEENFDSLFVAENEDGNEVAKPSVDTFDSSIVIDNANADTSSKSTRKSSKHDSNKDT